MVVDFFQLTFLKSFSPSVFSKRSENKPGVMSIAIPGFSPRKPTVV